MRRHKIYVEYLGLLGREIGLHFELHARYERAGRTAEKYLADAEPLLREDLAACEAVVAFMDRLMEAYPEAAGLSAGHWRKDYARKTEQLREHIRGLDRSPDGTDTTSP